MSDITLKSKQVCNAFIEKAQSEGIGLTPMQAIKLVYFAHAWKLGFTGEPLINEPVEAWQYGSVVPSVYHSLKIFGSSTINAPITYNQERYMISLILNDLDNIPENQYIKPQISEDDQRYIDAVWSAYKNLDAMQMSNMIHQEGTPWSQTWNNGCCPPHAVISNILIEEYYKNKIAKSNGE